MQIVKAVLGAGLFGLPYALKLLGMAGGIILFFIIGWLSYYCSAVLIRVHDVATRDLLRSLTYVELAKHCFGKTIAKFVYIFMVVTAIGSLGAYLVLIGNTLHSIWPSVSNLAFSGGTALVMLPFVLLRSTKFLSYTSVIGNLGVLVVVFAILYRAIEIGNFKPASEYTAFRVETFPSAFGLIGFIWTCSTTVITVEKAMTKRSEFFKSFQLATHIVFFFGSVFALLLVAAFDQETCDIIVLNLGTGNMAMTAKIAIALDLAFTYPLAMAPAREIVEKSMLHDSTPYLEMKRNIIRTVLVVLSFCIAFFPQFNIILNIVGGWSASILCFILPPLMLLQLRRFHLMAQDRQILYMVENKLLKTKKGGGYEMTTPLALPSIPDPAFELDESKHYGLPSVHRTGKMIRPITHDKHRSRRADDPTSDIDSDTPHYAESIRRAKLEEQDYFAPGGIISPAASRPGSRAGSRASSPTNKGTASRRSSLAFGSPPVPSASPPPAKKKAADKNGTADNNKNAEPNYHQNYTVDLDAPQHNVSSLDDLRSRVQNSGEAVTVPMQDPVQTKYNRGARRKSILRYRKAVKVEETCPIEALAVKHHPNVMVFHPWSGKLLGNRVQREKRSQLKKSTKDAKELEKLPFQDLLPPVPVFDPNGNVDTNLLPGTLIAAALKKGEAASDSASLHPSRPNLSRIPEQSEGGDGNLAERVAASESVSIENPAEVHARGIVVDESPVETPATRKRRPSVQQRRASLIGQGVPARVHMRIHGHKLQLPATLSSIDVLETVRSKSASHLPGTAASTPMVPEGDGHRRMSQEAPAILEHISHHDESFASGFGKGNTGGMEDTGFRLSKFNTEVESELPGSVVETDATKCNSVDPKTSAVDFAERANISLYPTESSTGLRLELISILPASDLSASVSTEADSDVERPVIIKTEKDGPVIIDADVVLDVDKKRKKPTAEEIALASSSIVRKENSAGEDTPFYKALERLLPPAMQKNPKPIDKYWQSKKEKSSEEKPVLEIPSADEVKNVVNEIQSKKDTLAVRDEGGRVWNAKLPYRRKLQRHQRALAILKIAGVYESIFLILVALFGVAVLVFTTVASFQDAISGPSDPVPDVCTVG